jgi:hypothetical protein
MDFSNYVFNKLHKNDRKNFQSINCKNLVSRYKEHIKQLFNVSIAAIYSPPAPPPSDRQRRQSKGCRSDRSFDRCAFVSLSGDAGQLVQRRQLPEDRSPIFRQALVRVPIEVFLGGRFGRAIAPHQEYDWWVRSDRLNQFPQEQGREKSAGI